MNLPPKKLHLELRNRNGNNGEDNSDFKVDVSPAEKPILRMEPAEVDLVTSDFDGETEPEPSMTDSEIVLSATRKIMDMDKRGSGSGKPALRKKGLAKRTGSAVSKSDTTESLPVLEAFQEFLDYERKRTRNRIVALIAFFVISLLVITSAGLYLGKTFMDQVRNDFKDVQDDVEANQQTAARTKQEIEDALYKLTSETSRFRKEFDSEKTTMSSTRATIESRTSAYSKDIEDMKDVISMLKLENSSMKGDLGNMETKWSTLVREQQELIDALQASTPTAEEYRKPIVKSPALAMSILPRGKKQPVGWRLPIPE